ncbi:hypothetical protein N865_10960 [Intrasporangium oryzae NRRL B-24470]|uniref:histidine kinase n=1 Tax=Intrasporangium oryzae NRRL B-24470 TaxID=1386089 RepID=W9G5M0_9MICO|nr:HAMP domain-containing sensor histidine kinase [Intrasporangium oryzae]EWT01330.1 hypothetical protein N865_10960 [Intrasporangium oryzae NRRL B-24470]
MSRPMLVVWVVVALASSALMWVLPGTETVPYHLGWATFALCYGLEQWSGRFTAWSLGAFTLVTGVIIVDRAATGVIDWQETAEIPLMLLLIGLMVWHVRRRNRALAAVTVLAERERREARARELLTRRTSHELRSPLTIARGYLEVIMGRSREPEEAADLRVVDEELTRLTRVCERLVRSMRVRGDLETTTFDVDAVLAQTAERWATVADRVWLLEARGGLLHGSPERLRAGLDTLVENAIRYTGPGDTIRLWASRTGDETISIGVADSGPGFSDDLIVAINGATSSDRLGAARDDLSQTGLGIGIVVDIATRRGGRIEAGRSWAGGAEVTMVLPVHPELALAPGHGNGSLRQLAMRDSDELGAQLGPVLPGMAEGRSA